MKSDLTVFIENLPAIISSLALLIGVFKGKAALDDRHAVQFEQNTLRGKELGLREQELKTK